MDILTDEHEREEAVRKWWHENWKAITLGIAIALGGLVGFQQYQAYKLEQDQQTALAVYQIQNQLSRSGVAALAEGEKFMQEHKDLYGSLVALDMAVVQLNAKKYEEAVKLLEFAKSNGGELIAPQTSIVTARVQAQSGDIEGAIKTLDGVKSEAYKAEVAEAKGDIYLSQGKRNEAHDAYLSAIDTLKAQNLQISPLLQIKFDSVIKEGDKAAYKVAAEQLDKINAVPIAK